MMRRIVTLLALAATGWYLYNRFFRSKTVYVGDRADLRPDEQRGGFAERVSDTASGAAAAARHAAQAPVDRIRSIVGEQTDATPEGERVVVPEGSAAEDAAAEMAAGYAPADEGNEPPPTPDAYRPAAEASPTAETAPRREAGATMPQEGEEGEQAPRMASTGAAGDGSDSVASDQERPIKGNVRPDGEKIYHMPGDPAYGRTNAERMFATVEEAEAAGFRRAGRPRET